MWKRRAWIIYVAAMLALAVLVAAGYWKEEKTLLASETARLQRNALLLDRAMERSLQTLGDTLELARQDLHQRALDGRPDGPDEDRLRAIARTSPSVRTLLVVNHEGLVIASSRAEMRGQRVEPARHASIRQHLTPNGLYLGPPYVTPMGLWVVNAARPLAGPNGEARGYLLATVALDFLNEWFDSALYAEGVRAGLLHPQGPLWIARDKRSSRPDPGVPAGLARVLNAHPSGQGAETSGLADVGTDDQPARYTLHPVTPSGLGLSQPLVVFVSRDEAALREPLRDYLVNRLVLLGLVALVLALLLRRWQTAAAVRAAREAEREAWVGQLQVAEARWQYALEGSAQGVWDWDLQAHRLFTSRRFEAMLGLAPGELDGRDAAVLERTHPEDRVVAEAAVARHFAGETPYYEADFRLRHADGRWRWIRSRGQLIERTADGQPKRMIGTHTDITAQREAEEQARRTARQLALALEGARIGIWHWNLVTQEVHWTDKAHRLLGLPADTPMTYDTWRASLHPECRERTERELQAGLASREPFVVEYRVVWPDGSVHWLESSGKAIPGPDGEPRTAEGVLREITVRKTAELALAAVAQERQAHARQVEQLNEQLRLRAADAETAMRAKEAFLTMVSHELRTPLNQIQGGLDLLLRGQLDERQTRWLKAVRASAGELTNRITQVLTYTESQANELGLVQHPFAPAAVLRELRQLFAPPAAAKGLDLRVETGPDLPSLLLGDAGRLTQALVNYLDNAVRFTDAGAVTLAARVQPASGPGLCLRFEVRDTGPGVDPAFRNHLFTPFSQAEEGLTRSHGGLGMGLSSTRAIAERMGGQVGLDDLPGGGSCFWMTACFIVPAAGAD